MPCDGIEDFRIVIIICYVYVRRRILLINKFSNMQRIWQLLAGVQLNSRDRSPPPPHITRLKILAQKTE
jgi:hypothetical protein